jgi:hypothetical protein
VRRREREALHDERAHPVRESLPYEGYELGDYLVHLGLVAIGGEVRDERGWEISASWSSVSC